MPLQPGEKIVYVPGDVEIGRPLDFGDVLDTQEAIQQRKEFFTNQREERWARSNQASFVFAMFKYGEHLFSDIPGMGSDKPPISDANLTRLFYLATFCAKDDEQGRLTYNNGKSFMNKQEVNKLLKISKNKLTEFWKQMTTYGIMYENEQKEVCISPDRFRKRKMRDDTNLPVPYADNYTRMYCQSVQALYLSCDSADMHKKLSYIFKMLPYINITTNVLSFNPDEKKKEGVVNMSFGDWCDAIGYDRKNARRLLRELTKITVEDGQHLIGFAGVDFDNVNTWRIVLNPKFFYGGVCRLRDDNINPDGFLYDDMPIGFIE